jgi:hypothetical protein
MQAVARLPQLIELDVDIREGCRTLIPVGLFSNLSKLFESCGEIKHLPFFISQMATVTGNSPQLISNVATSRFYRPSSGTEGTPCFGIQLGIGNPGSQTLSRTQKFSMLKSWRLRILKSSTFTQSQRPDGMC